jgi:peptidoglycan hydrolase-like protein with peptidoglycan-binding domain
MVQPKYSPEEALQRIKLMMEYDLSKTSTENKKVVSEQATDLTIDDIKNGKLIVKSGIKGPIVSKIQELLISAGYPNISKSGKPDNDFGRLTKAQVEKFQSENTNDKGEPLQKDGQVGPETIKALLKKSDVKMSKSARGETPTDLRLAPKEFGQIPNATQSVSQQTQETSDPFSCIKTFFQTKRYLLSSMSHSQNSLEGKNELEVTLKYENLIWRFSNWKDGKKTWKQYTNGGFTDNGAWSCDGDSNFTMESSVGRLNFNSRNIDQFISQLLNKKETQPAAQQTQPAAQQTQSVSNSTQDTELAAGYSDPNQQSTLRRRDSPLDDILKNQDINKSACRKNISDYFNAWRTRSVVPDDIQQASKNIVQQCANQNYGKFGIGGGKFDEMIDVLTGNHPSGIKQYGEDKQWRIQKPITIQNTRRK